MRLSSATLLLVYPLVAWFVHAASPPKVIHASRVSKPPRLDVQFAQQEWQLATPVEDFTQFDPAEGSPPTEKTSVRILYDNRALYVGVLCYDSAPKNIVGQLNRRDRTTEADRFTVMIDSYHDHQTAFVFSANVSGVQSDGVLSQDGNVYDITWDAVWKVSTRRTSQGWAAVFEIPYNAIRFAVREDNVHEWGINFRRYISRKKETDEWVMVPRSEHLQIARWGTVDGIRDITPPLHLELLPYVSGTATYQTETPDRSRSADYNGQAGFDLKYGLARNFTLDATFNPDFGQVEVDQAVLNLTVFETRFPEKRPFFLEGAQVFTFGSSVDNTPLTLFFSRRIGKRPTGSPFVVAPAGGVIENNPQVTTILGAAKLTGRSSSGFSLGLIAAATGEENAEVKDAAGVRSAFRTEPRGLYNVVRVKQDLQGTSWIGAMATLASRENTLPAVTGGIDWNLRFLDGAYTLDGYVAGAQSSNDASARSGTAGRLLFSKIAAEHWFYTASYNYSTRLFNINDAGFFAQPHDHGGYAQVLYRENFATGILRRYAFSIVPEARWNWDRVRTFAQVEGSFTGEFTNFWAGVLTFDHRVPYFDDAERGIVGIYRRPADDIIQLQVISDERKAVSATLTTGYEFDVRSKKNVFASLSINVRPTSWVELTPVLYYQQTRHEQAWLFPDGNITDSAVSPSPFSIFGDRNLDEFDIALRGTLTFTRALSLQFYTQVLLARGLYSNYQRLEGTGILTPYDYGSFSGFHSHDFNEATLNANLLLRWEYLPGSTLYLVWTQERFGDSGLYASGFGTRLRDTFTLPHEDVLLLKVSYWLPL